MYTLILRLTLLTPHTSGAQSRPPRASSAQVRAEAERAWKPFFIRFRSAVKRRDRAALKAMMTPDFLYTLGRHRDINDGVRFIPARAQEPTSGREDEREAAFRFWDDPHVRGWKAFDRVLAQGAVPMAAWWGASGSAGGVRNRVGPPAANRRSNIVSGVIDWYAVFEFGVDGRWYCTIFQQCCD